MRNEAGTGFRYHKTRRKIKIDIQLEDTPTPMLKRYMNRFYQLAIMAGANPDQANVIAKNKARRITAKQRKAEAVPIEGGEEEEVVVKKGKPKGKA